MADSTGIDTVLANFDRALDDMVARGTAALTEIAEFLEGCAKSEHTYKDRTSNLTNSINGFVQEAAANPDVITAILTATMEYAVFVELARDGKWAFLLPTLEKHEGDIRAILERHFAGTGGNLSHPALSQPISLPKDYEAAKQTARDARTERKRSKQ